MKQLHSFTGYFTSQESAPKAKKPRVKKSTKKPVSDGKPLPQMGIGDTRRRIEKLDFKLWENDYTHALFEKSFDNFFNSPQILKHGSMWAVIINAMITGIKYRPECTMCWITYRLNNSLNEIDASSDQIESLEPRYQIELPNRTFCLVY